MKIKIDLPFLYLLLDIFLISVIFTFYQLQYLGTSFKVNSFGNPTRLAVLSSIRSHDDSVLNRNIYIENKPLNNTGYTLSFSVKTLLENAQFFNTGSSKGGGSIYWNIYLVDGKIQTARLDYIPPVIVDQKINDGKWHDIVVSVGNEQKIYIDKVLKIRSSVGTPLMAESWFNFFLKLGEKGEGQVYLKDVLFINKSIPPDQIKTFDKYFSGEGTSDKVISTFLGNFAIIILIIFSLVAFIKWHYPQKPIKLIIEKISSISPLYIIVVLSLWTPFMAKVTILTTFTSSYYLLLSFRKILPSHIRQVFVTPISFFNVSLKLLFRDKRGLYPYLASLKPQDYFLLFFFINLLLFFDSFLIAFVP